MKIGVSCFKMWFYIEWPIAIFALCCVFILIQVFLSNINFKCMYSCQTLQSHTIFSVHIAIAGVADKIILLVQLCMYLYSIHSFIIFVHIFSYCVHQWSEQVGTGCNNPILVSVVPLHGKVYNQVRNCTTQNQWHVATSRNLNIQVHHWNCDTE